MAPSGRRVAVTGLGAVAALGNDMPSLWRAVRSGACGIRPIANIPTDRLLVRTAAEIVEFDAAALLGPRRAPTLDRTSQLALVAADEAMQDVELSDLDLRRAGVLFGGAIGLETIDNSYKALYADGVNRMHPLTVPRIMPSAPPSHISIAYGLRGPCFATASACSSASHAIGLAFHMVRAGMLDLAVTGGSDASIYVGFMKAWDALRVLSPDVCRPFSKDRTGLVIGEGAATLVLEDWDRAKARGATIHAEVVGFGMSADAADMTAPNENGAAQAMRDALTDADLPPESVDYVNAHGTGTRLNDRTEVSALRQVFGSHLDKVAVSSTKSMIGHCLNAGGALELLVTVLALRDGVLPPTIGFREHDPDCDVDCVPNEARHAAIEVAMSNSFAFGGLNAVLLARRAA